MTHRNRLLTFSSCAALIAGSAFITATPAAAAPNSESCVTAQVALAGVLDSASVDIALAYELKAALTAVEAASLALDEAWMAADAAAAEEYAAYEVAIEAYESAIVAIEATQVALDAAQTIKILADDRVIAAELALAAVADGDDDARLAAEAELAAALIAQADATAALSARQAERDAAPAAFDAADAALMDAQTALDNALYTEAVLTAENNYFAAIEVIEGVLSALGGPGTSVEEVQVLVNAAIAACAATGAGTGQEIEVPVVNIVPSTPAAPGTAAPAAGRGLNVQTAAAETSATDGGALAIGGLATGALLLLSGAAVWLRRSTRA